MTSINRTSYVPPSTQTAASTAPTQAKQAQAPAQPTSTASVQPTDQFEASAPTNAQLATRFYEAFGTQNLDAMKALYAPGATFEDPIYSLNGRDQVMGMWKGLFKAGQDVHITSKVLSSSGSTVTMAWQADYKLNGRPVHNESTTTLEFKDGKIVSQRDDWSWSKWAKQAFPLGGLVDFAPVKSGLKWLLNQIV